MITDNVIQDWNWVHHLQIHSAGPTNSEAIVFKLTAVVYVLHSAILSKAENSQNYPISDIEAHYHSFS